MNDCDVWCFDIAQPAVVHKGMDDGTVPVCLAAKREYGIGEVGASHFVCGSHDIPNSKKFLGYAGFTWCPHCEWALLHMETQEFMEFLRKRAHIFL